MTSTFAPPRRAAHVHSLEDAAGHGHEVRREGDDGLGGARTRRLGQALLRGGKRNRRVRRRLALSLAGDRPVSAERPAPVAPDMASMTTSLVAIRPAHSRGTSGSCAAAWRFR
jgi:hypothetical protein